MSAQPGWYDAGVPGQERWWDGTQWTAYERVAGAAVPVVSPIGQQHIVQQHVAQQPIAQQYAPAALLPPTGWYAVPGKDDVRWWDGAGWTPYRIRGGGPRPDWAAIEPAGTGLVLGVLFIFLGLTQFGLYSVSGNAAVSATPVLFIAAGIVWIIGGAHSSAVRKLPAPQTAAIIDFSVRPLPGEVEGVGAGWYPVAGQVTRWWTGTRWSWYIGQKFGVRPGQAGPRGYRVSMVLGWIFAGVGVLVVALGIVLIGAMDAFVGVAIVVIGVVLALAGGLIVLMMYLRRYALILPDRAPPLR